MDELKNVINEVVQRTFNTMTDLYKKTGKVETLLIFPKYTRGGKAGSVRVSEQELRQLFIEEMTHYVKANRLDLHYSVETPTKDGYKFVDKKPVACEDGRSAMFDLSIWRGDKKVALIEFKSATAEEFAYLKDLCKLGNKEEGGEDVLRYFINILEGANSGTVKRINKIISNAEKPEYPIELRLHSMNNPKYDESFPNLISNK